MDVAPDSHAFFMRMALGYRSAKILLVATRLHLFDHLEEWREPHEVANVAGYDARNTRIMLYALATMSVLQCDGKRFRNAHLASTHLVTGKDSYVGHNLMFLDMLWECWSHLEDVIRNGAPHRRLPNLLGKDNSFTEQYIRGMQPIAAAPAQEVARLLSDRPMKRMLDVGGGPGTFTSALLAKNPLLRATILDLPTTLTVTRELLRSDPGVHRVQYLPGDYLTNDYGSEFDLILMSHVTHDENEASVISMAQRAFHALKPGGRIAIHDWVLDEQGRPENVFQAIFGVNVMVYSDGQVYSDREYREMLQAAGFTHVESRPVLPDRFDHPTALMTALKGL